MCKNSKIVLVESGTSFRCPIDISIYEINLRNENLGILYRNCTLTKDKL